MGREWEGVSGCPVSVTPEEGREEGTGKGKKRLKSQGGSSFERCSVLVKSLSFSLSMGTA